MSTSPTTDRLREKINSYIELLNRIRADEGVDHGTTDANVLEILRPLIFVHWNKILRLVPENDWKDVCVEISKIDKMREKAKNAARNLERKMALFQQEEDDRRAAQALMAEMEKEEADRKAAAKTSEALATAALLANRFIMDDDHRGAEIKMQMF